MLDSIIYLTTYSHFGTSDGLVILSESLGLLSNRVKLTLIVDLVER